MRLLVRTTALLACAALLAVAMVVATPGAALAYSYDDGQPGRGLLTSPPKGTDAQAEQLEGGEPQGAWQRVTAAMVSGLSQWIVKAVEGVSGALGPVLFNPVVFTGDHPLVHEVGRIYDVVFAITVSGILLLILIWFGYLTMSGAPPMPPMQFIARLMVIMVAILYAPLLMQEVVNVATHLARVVAGVTASQAALDSAIRHADSMAALSAVAAIPMGLIMGALLLLLSLVIIIWGYYRLVMLYALFVVSPVAILAAALPNTSEIYAKWRNMFIKQTFLVVVWALWWRLGNLVAVAVTDNAIVAAAAGVAWGVGFLAGSNVLLDVFELPHDLRSAGRLALDAIGRAQAALSDPRLQAALTMRGKRMAQAGAWFLGRMGGIGRYLGGGR